MANNYQFNPAKWDWRSIGTYTSMMQGGFSGWQMGSRIENKVNSFLYRKQFDRYSDMIIDDFNSRFELKSNSTFAENYTASLGGQGSLEGFISIGPNEPYVTYRGYSTYRPNHPVDGNYDFRVQVYGSMYSEYNWIQSAKWENDPWKLDPDGFYYSVISAKDNAIWYKKPDADFYFQDSPNAEFFKAQLTLCGRRGESWYPIQTFEWGYSFNNGKAHDYFNKISNMLEIHQNNIKRTLRFFNINF